MIRRTVGTGAAVLVLVAIAAGCSSSSSKAASTTTKASTASTTSTAASTSTTVKTTSTTSATPTTSATHTTTAPVPPTDAETANKHFFAAWLAHDSADMNVNGTSTAVNEAVAQYAETAGSTWQFSNCQGAAGSIYCTWVRAAESVVLRASNVTPANRVIDFQWSALDAEGIADQMINAWQTGGTGALQALMTSGAYSQLQALQSHAHDGWQAPSSCDGTAGSFYCTYTAGSHKLNIQVGDVQVPHQVVGVTYA